MRRLITGVFIAANVALIAFALFSPHESPFARIVAVVVGVGGLVTLTRED